MVSRRVKVSNLNVGDKVYHDGNSGFCHMSICEITKVSYKWEEDTGEKYKVLHIDEKKFDARNGYAINPPLAYFITPCNQK